MRIKALVLSLLITSTAFSLIDKPSYNGSPVIKAKTNYSEYRVGQDWYKGHWSIAPQVEHDTLQVVCFAAEESFEFKTDIESIELKVSPNSIQDFYVQMDENVYAHTIIKGIQFQTNSLAFDNARNPKLQFKYQKEESTYLEELKTKYPLDFVKDEMTDAEIVMSVLDWTHSRWSHDSYNAPSKNDAITILNEAAEGQRFPCFAYAIVLRDQLNALGYSARTVYLKSQDAKTRQNSPGHVATEVYLDDIQKWAFLDGQFNVMPFLNEAPLNAIEFQNAITHDFADFELRSVSKEYTSKTNYVNFVYDYLYYFDTGFDHRYGNSEHFKVDDKRSIMLVPSGAENLTYVQLWDLDINYCFYTNSISDFYAKPQ